MHGRWLLAVLHAGTHAAGYRRVRLMRVVRSLFCGQVGCGRDTDDIPYGDEDLGDDEDRAPRLSFD